MSFKIIKKTAIAGIFAIFALIISFSVAFSGCTIKTSHPRALITIEFQDKNYEIEYEMYRNLYPQTVQHFIELASNDFYNDTIVHNYTTGELVGGTYAYNNDENNGYAASNIGNSLVEYLANNNKVGKNGAYSQLFADSKLSASVYASSGITFDPKTGERKLDESKALPTLYGEFTDNGHTIEKGALTQGYGSLTMNYYRNTDNKGRVAVKTGAGEILERDAKNNCATAAFKIQINSSNSGSPNSVYCVFGKLRNESAEKTLKELVKAIDKYKEDNSGSFTKSTTAPVYDFTTDNTVDTTANIPVAPIIIRSVKITKY